MFDFFLERYNYWIFIVLMMTGLYIVISRGNLVKKLIGLNVFQTSVFIFYISIGKIVGGTAPILPEHHGEEGGHGGASEAGRISAADEAHGHAAGSIHESSMHEGSLHEGVAANALPAADGGAAAATAHSSEGLHHAGAANPHLAAPAGDGFTVVGDNVAGAAKAAAGHAAEIVYTNPLPHVLILTAIVVGVATTAVGLALAVRIREAYGTIEEDELAVEDQAAEFGAGAARPGAAA